MTRKQQILSNLTKASLNAIAKEHGVKGAFHMYTEDLVRVLSRMRSVNLEDILSTMSLQDLKIICQNIELDDKGNNKASRRAVMNYKDKSIMALSDIECESISI